MIQISWLPHPQCGKSFSQTKYSRENYERYSFLLRLQKPSWGIERESLKVGVVWWRKEEEKENGLNCCSTALELEFKTNSRAPGTGRKCWPERGD